MSRPPPYRHPEHRQPGHQPYPGYRQPGHHLRPRGTNGMAIAAPVRLFLSAPASIPLGVPAFVPLVVMPVPLVDEPPRPR